MRFANRNMVMCSVITSNRPDDDDCKLPCHTHRLGSQGCIQENFNSHFAGTKMATSSELDPHLVKCIGLLYESKKLRKGDPVPLQYLLEEAIFQKFGVVKDYTDIFQSFLPSREEDNVPVVPTATYEEPKASSSDNELELDLLKEDLMCIVCNEMDVGARNRLLECSDCHSLYHQECHRPVVSAEDTFDDWTCSNCKTANKKSKNTDKDKEPHSSSSSSSKNPSKSSSSSSHKHSSSSHKSSSSSKSKSPSTGSSKSNTVKPNINIVNADKKPNIIKKKSSSSPNSKSGEKRKHDH